MNEENNLTQQQENDAVITRKIATGNIKVPEAQTIISKEDNGNIQYNCPNCGKPLSVDGTRCKYCNTEYNYQELAQKEKNRVIMTPIAFSQKVGVPISKMASLDNISEDVLLDMFIEKNLKEIGLDKDTKKLPREVYIRKIIISLIIDFLIAVLISLVFFHFPIYTYIIGIILLIIVICKSKNFDMMTYLRKEIKRRPNEKISNIIRNTNENLKEKESLVGKIGLVLAIIIPLIIFIKPLIIYEKQDNGYAVRYYAFGITNFKTAEIPAHHNELPVIALRGNTFSNMPFLTEVTLPDTIKEIRGQAFKNDKKLKKVDIPKELEYLGGGAFYNCSSIEKIILPDTLKEMGGETFYKAVNLKEVKLSNQLPEIRGNSFEECHNLERIEIPDSVTRIGGHAFYNCYSLTDVLISENSQLSEIGSSAFRLCHKLNNIKLPKNTVVDIRSFKESPTVIERYGFIETSRVQKHTHTIYNTIGTTITTEKYGNIFVTTSNLHLEDDVLVVTLTLSGGINETRTIRCDESTTYFSEDFYIVTNKYHYLPISTTYNFYYE